MKKINFHQIMEISHFFVLSSFDLLSLIPYLNIFEFNLIKKKNILN